MNEFVGAWIYFKNADKIYFSNREAMLKYLEENRQLDIEAFSVSEYISKSEYENMYGKLP